MPRIILPKTYYDESLLLYTFRRATQPDDGRTAVWLHVINKESAVTHGTGYAWWCSCGAGGASPDKPGRPLTTQLLREAWDHFEAHPGAVPVRRNGARWYRGGKESDLDEVLKVEAARILGTAPELPVEVVNRCGTCGEYFEISESDPHWKTGRGPICPREKRGSTQECKPS